jgi:Tfp pilus assembly protein PilN
MIFARNTALGIDISDNRISLALLRRRGKGIELVRTAEGPVPDGAVKDGNIADGSALSQAIKQLKRGICARSVRAAASLFARPVLLQIMDMPKGLPTNVRQFIANEIKQCVVLPGKKAAFDFCGVRVGRKASDTRLFVAAADNQSVTEVGSNYSQGVLNIEVIEPSLLACIRALYAKKIAGKFDSNVLVAMLQDDILTLCVFKNQAIDFVRTKVIEVQDDETGLCRWLAEQINEIIQFYDVEFADNAGEWEITVVCDNVELPTDARETLKAEVRCVDLEVRTRQDGLRNTGIIGGEQSAGASLVAAGLAMRLLETKDHGLKINLFPPEASEVKLLRKDFLVASGAMAIVIAIMMLMTGALSFVTQKIRAGVTEKGLSEQVQQTYDMIHQQDQIKQQIEQLSGKPNGLTRLQSLQQEVDWLNFLNDVRAVTPRTVRITNLSGGARDKVVIEGLAMSYESIHLFVNMLNKSEYIAEASLAGTEKKTEGDGFVKYSINCVLTKKKENSR